MITNLILTLFFCIFLIYNYCISSSQYIGSYVSQHNKHKLTHIHKLEQEPDYIGIFKEQSAIIKVDDIKHRRPWDTINSRYFNTHHNGQLKLLLSEIQFCSKLEPSSMIVYAGSSPNNKGNILNNYFPKMTFVLVDPAEHLIYMDNTRSSVTTSVTNHYSHPDNIIYFCSAPNNRFGIQRRMINILEPTSGKIWFIDKSDPKVLELSNMWKKDKLQYLPYLLSNDKCTTIIIEDYYCMKTAELFSKCKHHFISDIRTNIYDGMHGLSSTKSPSDLDVVWNLAMMLAWVRVQRPIKSVIKYRLPYFNRNELSIFDANHKRPMYAEYFNICNSGANPIDYVQLYHKKQIAFIAGQDYLQAYADVTSGETRLTFNDSDIDNIQPIDYVQREEKLFYYNSIQRLYGCNNNPIDPISGIDHCGDCALGMTILADYIRDNATTVATGNVANTPVELMRNIMTTLGRSLIIKYHGWYTSPIMNVDDIRSLQWQISSSELIASIASKLIQNIATNTTTSQLYHIWDIISKLDYNDPAVREININKATLYKALIRYKPEVHHIIIAYMKAKFRKRLAIHDDEVVNAIVHNYNSSKSTTYTMSMTSVGGVSTYTCGDFKLKVSDKWWFHDNLNELILLDERVFDSTTNVNTGIFTCSDKLLTIFEQLTEHNYSAIVEISLGYDSILQNIPNYSYYNYVPNTLTVLPEINNQTIIFINNKSNPLLTPAIMEKYKHNLVIAADAVSKLPNHRGWLYYEPHIGLDFMHKPIKSHAKYTTFNFTGPTDVLYSLQKKNIIA